MREDTVDWNEETIKSHILNMLDDTGLERMPTHREMKEYYGNYGLTNAISKRQGSRYFAHILGLTMKDSETTVGKKYEKHALAQLLNLGYEVDEMPQNFPYDLLVEDGVKIDVKSSNLYEGAGGNFYSCNLYGPYATCDIFLVYLLKRTGEVNHTLVLPSKFVSKHTQISIGETESKYYQYINRWDYLDDFVRFYKKIA